jgi:hypothetical protein
MKIKYLRILYKYLIKIRVKENWKNYRAKREKRDTFVQHREKILNSLIKSNENSFEKDFSNEDEFYSQYMKNTSRLFENSDKEDLINLSLFEKRESAKTLNEEIVDKIQEM